MFCFYKVSSCPSSYYNFQENKLYPVWNKNLFAGLLWPTTKITNKFHVKVNKNHVISTADTIYCGLWRQGSAGLWRIERGQMGGGGGKSHHIARNQHVSRLAPVHCDANELRRIAVALPSLPQTEPRPISPAGIYT